MDSASTCAVGFEFMTAGQYVFVEAGRVMHTSKPPAIHACRETRGIHTLLLAF